jgi:oligosaccharyltransferase complex subunit beta
MLDPWVRTTLVKGQGNNYHAEFYAPLKEGIYQYKIIYKKPGFNFIKEAERVTIRPYKHDEFERFLFVAYPYFFGTFGTIIATFIFIVLYLYSGSTIKRKED